MSNSFRGLSHPRACPERLDEGKESNRNLQFCKPNCTVLESLHPGCNQGFRYNVLQSSDFFSSKFLASFRRAQQSHVFMQNEVWNRKAVFKTAAVVLLVLACCFAQESQRTAQQTPPSAASENVQPCLDPLPQDTGTAGLKQELRRLQNSGRLMMVTAHPDDEDGGLLTLEARGKGVHALLMTLTRGEGGQNELGAGLFDQLGVIRTLEQLASDRYYGVDQRFSHVADFGYSKTPEETFQKWGGHDVPLADMVRVIREFRPDVLIARFSGTERDGHGHHQASAILTKEAFRAAGDPNRFPEQIREGLQPWQPKKVYVGNVCGFMATSCEDENWTVKLSTSDEDPLLGTSYVQFAIQGLRHQKSQGLGDIHFPGGPRYAFYKLVDSVLPKTTDASGHEKDFFDGIDTSLPGLAARLGYDEKQVPWFRAELTKIGGEIGDSVGSLSNVYRDFESLNSRADESDLSPETKQVRAQYLSEKSDEAATALNLALDLSLEATVAPPQGPAAALPPEKNALTNVSPGQKFEVVAKLHNSSKYWLTIDSAALTQGWAQKSHAEQTTIGPGEDYYANFLVELPQDAPLTRPYWHRDDPQTESVNKVEGPYQTRALPPPPLGVKIEYEISGKRGLHSPAPSFLKKHSAETPQGRISSQVVVPFLGDHGVARKRELAITPAFSVALEPGEQVIPVAGAQSTTVKVGVNSTLTAASNGTLRLELPDDWRAQPENLSVSPAKRGDQLDSDFKVLPKNLKESRANLQAVLDVRGKTYSETYTLVTREDIGSFYFYQPAVQHVSIVDVKVPKDLKVGYIMGAGDDIPTALQQIGMNVTLIPADKLANEDLSRYGSIVLGVRAYETQSDVVKNNAKLLEFVSSGGTLVVQNNNDVGDFNSGHLTPYSAELSRARVSVEEAPVKILSPDDPVFHSPNEISQKDFDGWVQERGLYFMDKWDDHFKPLLECHDPNEPEQKGGLLLAKYGKGTYIYTGYAFFRQLPAGVPGAIRLFVNLVSAGKTASSH
jgi:LmbE family N-acetylglucosaminyl deacetylase